MVLAPLLGGVLVLIATRHDPLLSPDSITYLSVADHIRSGQGMTDFTDKPLAVFGPIYPLLLMPGGRSLMWATLIGAVSIAAGAALMGVLLRRRVGPSWQSPARWRSAPAKVSCAWRRWCGARRRTQPSRWRRCTC